MLDTTLLQDTSPQKPLGIQFLMLNLNSEVLKASTITTGLQVDLQ